MTVVSNGQFWIYTITLLIIWIIVVTTASNDEYRTKNKSSLLQTNAEDELKYTGICKNLCKLCNCLGFYCGEECICECNNDHTDMQCIRKIQRRGQSLNIPFEVLIQGPTANKFVRNALSYEQNQERKLSGHRNKRSTVTVYKPSKASRNKTAFKDIFKAAGNLKKRRKRSSSNKHFEWFSNLGNNLLRPAPLGGCKHQVEEIKKPIIKATTISSIIDNSWIFNSFDDSYNILTPRPLKKRKNAQNSAENKEVSNVNIKLGSSSHASNQVKDNDPEDGKIDFNYSKEYKKSVLPDETALDKSEENLISSLYDRLFKSNLDKMGNKYSFTSDEKYQEQSQETPLYKDEFTEDENDKTDLFLSKEGEEDEEENMPKETMQESKPSDVFKSQNDLPTSQNLLPINIKKGLHEIRIPWFKPGKLFQKFRQAIYS